MRWRGWLAWAGVGSAVALGYRGDWLASGGAVFGAALIAAWWLLSEIAATRERWRVSAEMSAALAEVIASSRPAVGTPALPSGAPELFP